MQHISTPTKCSPRRDWSTSEVFIEIFDFPIWALCSAQEPKTQNGKHPHATGPKKVKSKILLGECCFFALMRVAFKSRALRARFEKVGFQIIYMGVWVVVAPIGTIEHIHHVLSSTMSTQH